MSPQESSITELDYPAKRRIQRRHGACEPCRSSKTKCDGRTPCGACRSERRRQCPCVYSEKAMKLQQVTAEIRRRAESEKRTCEETTRLLSDDETRVPSSERGRDSVPRALNPARSDEVSPLRQIRELQTVEFEPERAKMSRPLSTCTMVEEFKKLKPARGYSAQVVSRCDGFDVARHTSLSKQIRNAARSAVCAKSPQHRILSTNFPNAPIEVQLLAQKFNLVDNLIKEGQLSQAWIDLGSVVREVQMIQASKDPLYLASTNWQQLCNGIMDTEALLGLTLGNPTSAPITRTTEPHVKNDAVALEESLDETRTDLYQHIHGILNLDLLNTTAIRDFLERARDVLHHEPFNQIGLCTTNDHSSAVRDLHLNTHLLFTVTLCRMASLCDLFSRDLTNVSWSETPAAGIVKDLCIHQPRQKLAYCRRMFRSARFILESFFGLYQDNTELTGTFWLRCNSAYVSALLLGIAKLRHEVEWHATTDILRRLEHLFTRLSQSNPDCYLFSSAVERLRDLNSVKEPASEATRNKHTGIKTRKRAAPNSIQDGSEEMARCKTVSESNSSSHSPVTSQKRKITMVEEPIEKDHTAQHSRYMNSRCLRDQGEHPPHPPPNSSFGDLDLEHLSLFQDNSATYSQSSSGYSDPSVSSAATSFSESEMPLQAVSDISINHPGPPFAYPFPFTSFHPPMAWNNPAYSVNDQDAGQLVMPAMPHYGPGASPLTSETNRRYALLHSAASISPGTNSHQASPLQIPPNRSARPSRLSPAVHTNTGFESLSTASVGVPGNSGRPYTQQAQTPTNCTSLSTTSRRQSLDRKHSSETMRRSPSPAQADERQQPHQQQQQQQSTSIEWHPVSAISISHNVDSRFAHGSLVVSDLERGSIVPDIRQPGLHDRSVHEQRSCYHTTFPQQPPPGVLGGQLLNPEQIAYLNAASGMFDSQQVSPHYAQSHINPYTKFYVQDSEQFPDQWRRLSTNANGSAAGPF